MTGRRALPQRRDCETFSLPFWGDKFHVTIGFYADMVTPGEIFIAGSKSGVQLDSVCRDSAVLLSLAMQHGVSIETIAGAITRNTDGSASTIVGAIVDRLVEASERDGAAGDRTGAPTDPRPPLPPAQAMESAQ